MIPHKHPLCNDLLRSPADNCNCEDLHIMRGEDAFMLGNGHSVNSFWMPSPEELSAINAGHPIVLHARGTTHPPVLLFVLDQPYALPVPGHEDELMKLRSEKETIAKELDRMRGMLSDWKAEAERWRNISMGHESNPIPES